MLGSRREGDRTEGLKRVIAVSLELVLNLFHLDIDYPRTQMMTKDLPVTTFFPLVTSLLSPSTPLNSRTLISLYIIHCAATAPELALLSINAYQKDLSDPNPIIRAGAIKTLSSMGLEDTRSLVGVAVSKGARDGAWYVRRASADAVSALWHADPTYDNRATLLPTLIVLLNTASPLTIGSALSAWEAMCPTRWDLVHPGYRKWCKMLVDVEEWGQCVLLRVLVRYGRTFFRDPRSGEVDPDLELLLRASEPLLQHMNPAVSLICLCCRADTDCASRSSRVSSSCSITSHPRRGSSSSCGHYSGYSIARQKCKPLYSRTVPSLRRRDPYVQHSYLSTSVLTPAHQDLLIDHVALFYVRFSEPIENKRVRLRILVALASETNVRALLNEFLVRPISISTCTPSDSMHRRFTSRTSTTRSPPKRLARWGPAPNESLPSPVTASKPSSNSHRVPTVCLVFPT
jgi:AP-3 complex subunit beta